MQGQALLAGISPHEFWNITLREYHHCLFAWGKNEERRQQGEWERIRWLATVTINPHLKNSIKPTDLMQFPWEKETKSRIDWEAVKKRMEHLPKHIEVNHKRI